MSLPPLRDHWKFYIFAATPAVGILILVAALLAPFIVEAALSVFKGAAWVVVEVAR